MFGKGFENCWYAIPRVPGLELSGDLRFRGPRGLRKLRHDSNGRPYIQARKVVGHESDGEIRKGRVMLHRAVMTWSWAGNSAATSSSATATMTGETTGRRTFISGDQHSNAADSLRNGRHVRGEQHPSAKLSDEQVREIRRPCLEASGVVTLPEPVGCIRARSAGSSTACVAGRANRAEHDRRVAPPGPIATDLSLCSPSRREAFPLFKALRCRRWAS